MFEHRKATDRHGKDEDEGIVVKSWTWEFCEGCGQVWIGQGGVWSWVAAFNWSLGSSCWFQSGEDLSGLEARPGLD
jgi:hypothetical protein